MSYLQNAIEELAAGNVQVLNIPPAPIIVPEIDDIENGKYFFFINLYVNLKNPFRITCTLQFLYYKTQ